MSDEEVDWSEDHDEYVRAFVHERRESLDVARAYEAFERARRVEVGAPRYVKRGLVVFAVAASLAAAAVLWSSGEKLLATAQSDPGGMAPDTVEDTDSVYPATQHAKERGRDHRTSPKASRDEAPEPVEPSLDVAPTVAEEGVELPTGLSASPASRPDGAKPRRRPGRAAVEPAPAVSEQHNDDAGPSTLDAELAVVSTMRAALRRGDFAGVLEHAAKHKTMFDSPSMATERDFLALEALCGLGDAKGLEAAKQRFATRHPKHHLSVRAQKICDK